MASEKNSRLINLVIALLATKKFLTKPQIFKAVEGYEGSAEANDRMFERDKEELRALGIEIEMKSIDPLFEDEIGYRIRPERYRLDLGPLTSEEVQVLALAAEAWSESAFKEIAASTKRRLESLGINSDFTDIPQRKTFREAPKILLDLLDAIENRRLIQIHYVNIENKIEKRELAPHGIYSRGTHWYLFALEIETNLFKSFRLDRIEGEVALTKKYFEPQDVAIPEVHFEQIPAILEIRRDFAADLLRRGEVLDFQDEWLRIKIEFESLEAAVSEILRNTPNVKAIEPKELVNQVVEKLDLLVRLHER